MQNADKAHADCTPLSFADLDKIFSCMLSLERVVLAVSGGADSLALMVLVAEWQRERHPGLDVHVASVDHGLRAEAAAECALVAELAAHLGFSHQTLIWSEADPALPNLQACAREARYTLLLDHVCATGGSHLAVGHHLDDQAETFLMRLLRGSGVPGLAAMRGEVDLGEVKLLRPLLEVPKTRLQASLLDRKIDWVDDPSNQNADYLRVRVRDLLPHLAEEGCDSRRLAATALRMQRADDALEAITQSLLDENVTQEPGRALFFECRWYEGLLEELRLRLLRMMIEHVAATVYPPREERLVALDQGLLADAEMVPVKRTLAGCCFEKKGGRIWIYRELGRAVGDIALEPNVPTCWSQLYEVVLNENVAGVTLRPLGRNGRLGLAKMGLPSPVSSSDGETLPKAVIEAMLAVWYEGMPVAVVDWPEIAINSDIRVDFRGKHTRFTNNQGLA